MANYIARVELKVAVPEDYERLNLSMQRRGYARKITGEDGVIYQLPTGTYFVTDTSAVLEVAPPAAAKAANKTERNPPSSSRIGAPPDGVGWRRTLRLDSE